MSLPIQPSFAQSQQVAVALENAHHCNPFLQINMTLADKKVLYSNTKGQAGSSLIAAHSSPEWRLQYLVRSLYVTKAGLVRPILYWMDGQEAREQWTHGLVR